MHLNLGQLWVAKIESHSLWRLNIKVFKIIRWLMFLSLLVLRWPTLSGSRLAEVVRNKVIAYYYSFLKRQIHLSSAAVTPFSACHKIPHSRLRNQIKSFRATSFEKYVFGSHSPGSPAPEPQWFPETGIQIKIWDASQFCSGMQVKSWDVRLTLRVNSAFSDNWSTGGGEAELWSRLQRGEYRNDNNEEKNQNTSHQQSTNSFTRCLPALTATWT